MLIPTKKLQNGFEMPVYGLGTFKMAGKIERDTTDDEKNISAIKMAIENGVRHIDTAEVYAAGGAEELVAQALQQTEIARDELFITTKVSPEHTSYDDVLRSCGNSLERLQMDYVDLYLVHFPPSLGIDIRDTMRALDELKRQGLVRNVGVSNFTPHRYEVAQSFSANKLVCNQVNYSLMVREIEKYDLLQHARENDYIITAWRPLQLSFEPGVNSYPPIVAEMAEKYGKTPNQIAINWLISQPNVVTISKTASPEHLTENLGALDWQMSAEDIEKLRRDYPAEYFCAPRYELDKIESSIPAE
jgi:diketogulonate reductase-like aldo/keto reductase